jgi:predicted ATPase
VVTLANGVHHDCLFHQLARDSTAVRSQAQALTSFATEHGLPFWQALGGLFHGWALVRSGRIEEGLAELRAGLTAYRATGGRLYLPYAHTLLADACHQAGARAAGLEALAEARSVLEETGVRGFEAQVHQVEGRLLLLAPAADPAAAERCFEAAIGVARRQGARLPQLRAALDLARLWAGQGQRSRGYDLIAPLYTRFSEGFGTVDLRDAAALLDELRP